MERAVGIITTNYSVAHPSALTGSRPPAALPIGGRYRMVDFILSSMVNSGMRNVGIILPYNYRSLIDHLESGKDWNLDRKHGGLFLLPGSAFGSTRSGARFLIRDLEDNRVFLERSDKPYVILAAANIIFNMDLTDLVDEHIKSGADITVACQKATEENTALMGFALEDGKVAGVHMGVSYGDCASLDCCVMSVDIMKQLLKWYSAVDYLDLFEALSADLSRVDVRPYYYSGEALAVFSSKAYYKNSMKLLDPSITDEIFSQDNPVHTKAHDNPPAKYEPGAKVENSLVAGGCQISGDVRNSIIGRDVIIEAGATVQNSIVLQSCVIEAGARLDCAIVDRNNTIAARTELRGTPEDILIKGRGFN